MMEIISHGVIFLGRDNFFYPVEKWNKHNILKRINKKRAKAVKINNILLKVELSNVIYYTFSTPFAFWQRWMHSETCWRASLGNGDHVGAARARTGLW